MSGAADRLIALPAVLLNAGIELYGELVALEAGLSNSNFLFLGRLLSAPASAAQKMVLRVNSLSSDNLCNRQDELICWQLAQQRGIAPKLIWFSGDERYYVSEYIEQSAPYWSVFDSVNSAADIANLLNQELTSVQLDKLNMNAIDNSKLDESHRYKQAQDVDISAPEKKLLALFNCLSQLPTPFNAISVRQQWDIYRNKLESVAAELTNGIPTLWARSWNELRGTSFECEQWLLEVEACLIRPQYCHRDLNPSNLLLSVEQLYCIDFEYACASHPLFDLAGIVATHKLNSSQCRFLLLEAIKNNPNMTNEAVDAIGAAVNLFWLFACAWALLMAAQTDNTDEHQKYLGWYSEYVNLLKV